MTSSGENETCAKYPNGLPPEAITYARTFFGAARTGDVEAFKAPLEAGLPPNLTNENGDTVLMLACYHGHLPLVQLLLDHKADPNRINDKGQSILAGAIFKNEREIVEALVKAGADPEVGSPSAMDSAKIFGQEQLVDLLQNAPGRGKGHAVV